MPKVQMNGSSWQRPLPFYRTASLRQRLNQTCCSLFSWELSFSFKNPFFYTTLSLIWWKFSYKFHARKKFFLKVMFVYVLFYFTVITLILRLKTSFFMSINVKNHLTEQKRTLQVWVFLWCYQSLIRCLLERNVKASERNVSR